MNYGFESKPNFGENDSYIDWQSSEPIRFGAKIRTFLNKAILDFWNNKITSYRSWIFDCSAAERRAESPVYQECAPLSRSDHLVRAAGVIEAGVANFGRVRGCQRAAARQLNAADYALQDLLSELAMAIPKMNVKPVQQAVPVAVSQPLIAEPESVVTEEDGALAA
jgi:hypothetical protein